IRPVGRGQGGPRRPPQRPRARDGRARRLRQRRRRARPRRRRRRLRRPFVPEVALLTVELGPAHVRFTGRGEGDMGHGGAYVHQVAPDVEARRRAVVDAPWTWLRQVHGDTVVTVAGPGAGAGTKADA